MEIILPDQILPLFGHRSFVFDLSSGCESIRHSHEVKWEIVSGKRKILLKQPVSFIRVCDVVKRSAMRLRNVNVISSFMLNLRLNEKKLSESVNLYAFKKVEKR